MSQAVPSTHSFIKATPREARRLIKIYLHAGVVPFIKSSPGVGKSSIVSDIFKELGLYMRDHRMSTSLPEDMNGLPRFTGEGDKVRATFTPFDIFPLESDPVPDGYEGHGLFLDEFNSADRQVQATCYKVILDKIVGQSPLHPKTVIVLAGNLATDNAIVNELGTAMQSRVAHIQLVPDTDEWLQDFAFPKNFEHEITSYTKFSGNLVKFDPDHDEETFPCPRTYEFLDNALKAMKRMGTPYNPDTDAIIAAGVIGASEALTFNTFMRVYTEVPAYKAIVADPAMSPPIKKDAQWATLGSINKNFQPEDIKPILEYASRFPSEMRIMLLRMLRESHPELRTEQPFVEEVVRLSKHLNGKPL